MTRFARRISVAALSLIVLTFAGCDLTDLNDNPNAPTEVTPTGLLSGAQVDLANQYWRDYAGAYWMRYAQYLTTNQYTTADRFGFASRRSGALDAHWENFNFVSVDLQEIKRVNRTSPGEAAGFGPNENQIAIAKILQAWTFQLMTDIWGPVPFTEALQGRTTGNFSPAYTAQEEIYPALIDSLTAASEMIDTSAPTLASGDIMYGGDMSKWKKFANALKMRVAMRMSDQRPDAAATAIDEAIQAGTFESNADNALISFNSSPPFQNPIYENYEVAGRDDWAAPQALVGLMNEYEDPRRPAFFTDADADSAGNQFNGFPYGLSQGAAQSLFTNPNRDFSRPGLRVRQADAPAILLLYDEVLFIKAEAALRSDMDVPSITKSGQQLYEDAIAASARYWGVSSQSEIQNFLSRVPDVNESNYEQVLGTQKWIAQYLQGVQGWSNWRRLDFQGVLQVPPGNPGESTFGREIAVRMSYPDDEATLNSENLENAVNNLLGGPDDQGTLLWWDTEYVPPR